MRASEPDTAALPRLSAVLDALGRSTDWVWAWETYKELITALGNEMGLTRQLEVGGGRHPLFTPAEASAHGFAVTINDISADELARAPREFAQLHCDIASRDPLEPTSIGAYDLVYSKMVMEHVQDATQMWRNQYELLAPGGIALAFIPTLFAPAFAANHVLPDPVSSAIVGKLFPGRSWEGTDPKFPAHYDLCYGDQRKVEPTLRAIGYDEVHVLPFYGYSYFDGLPGLRRADRWFTEWARRHDRRRFTSFAYVIGVKGTPTRRAGHRAPQPTSAA